MAQETEKRIDDRIEELLKLEGELVRASTSARYLLMDAQEEIRALRQEVVKAQLRYLTEQQLADELQVSKDTIARLRRRKKIPFVQLKPGLYRYTSEQKARIAELCEVKPKQQLAKAS